MFFVKLAQFTGITLALCGGIYAGGPQLLKQHAVGGTSEGCNGVALREYDCPSANANFCKQNTKYYVIRNEEPGTTFNTRYNVSGNPCQRPFPDANCDERRSYNYTPDCDPVVSAIEVPVPVGTGD